MSAFFDALSERAENINPRPRGDFCADARSQRGLVTSLESDARGREELVNALGHLTSRSLPLGSPSLAR